MNGVDLIVFATELSRRQFVRRQVLEDGFVDSSRLLTFARLRAQCASAARLAGLLPGPELTEVGRQLLINKAARLAAAQLPARGRLGNLSAQALAETIEALIETLAPFGDDAQAVCDWLAQQTENDKLRELAIIYDQYRALCAASKTADARDINAAIIRLLEGDRRLWPPLLSQLEGRIVFRSVRWLNPFEEKLTILLKKQLGRERVAVLSALPPAHAEKMEDRLASRIRSEVLMGSDEAWPAWAENLTDALEVDDSHIALDSWDRLSFSRSAGLYGEVEDIARRIRWEISHRNVRPERIGLIVRNLGEYADSVAHVFKRFGIPCFFRRGQPASSFAGVKTLLSILSLPLDMSRDRFCALLQTPDLRWDGLEPENRHALAADILAAGVGPVISAETVRQCLRNHYARLPGGAPTCLDALLQHIARLRALAAPAPLQHHARNALDLIRAFGLSDLALPGSKAHATNHAAIEAAACVIDEIARASASESEPCAPAEFNDLLLRCLENVAISPGGNNESGVWVLNPFDAAGLSFDVVLIAGLNEGLFPAIPRQDPLFSDDERKAIRNALAARSVHLPQWALPLTTVRMLQENILFLISLGAARDRLLLSYQACDTDGRDKAPGDYFRSVWNLAGWPARDEVTPDEYEDWRIGKLGPDSLPARYLRRQLASAPHQRQPMPGESYFATVPLPLCCAPDEARQRIARSVEDPRAAQEIGNGPAARLEANPVDRSISARIAIELARERFFNSNPTERPTSQPYCGKLCGDSTRRLALEWLSEHAEISPTALETLARCRFRFLLSQIARLEELRVQEDTPDILDRGKLLHRALECVYRALAGDTNGIDELDPTLSAEFADICRTRHRALEVEPGAWILADSSGDTSRSLRNLPLASFEGAKPERYLAFATAVTNALFARLETGAQPARLGDPGIWSTERPKIRRIIANYVQLDAECAASENRFPAFTELRFGRQHGNAPSDAPALVIDAVPGGRSPASGPLLVRGQVDRIDLCFDPSRRLSRLLVIDYKSGRRGHLPEEQYKEEIASNLNCQLPIYAFAAQQFFFGRHNELGLNEMTDVVYHIQDRELAGMKKQFEKRRINMNAAIEGKGPIADLFVSTLLDNLAKLNEADFAVDPLDCAYCDFTNICRVDVNALVGKDGQEET